MLLALTGAPPGGLEWQEKKTHVGLALSTSMTIFLEVERATVTKCLRKESGADCDIHVSGRPLKEIIALTFSVSLFCQSGTFSLPVTAPTWWYTSLSWVIALLSALWISSLGLDLDSLLNAVMNI